MNQHEHLKSHVDQKWKLYLNSYKLSSSISNQNMNPFYHRPSTVHFLRKTLQSLADHCQAKTLGSFLQRLCILCFFRRISSTTWKNVFYLQLVATIYMCSIWTGMYLNAICCIFSIIQYLTITNSYCARPKNWSMWFLDSWLASYGQYFIFSLFHFNENGAGKEVTSSYTFCCYRSD